MVIQLTDHLRVHKTDYSTRRGLMAVLSKRKQLLKYLRSKDKAAYERCINELGIRQLKAEV
jgi:small subunit ribosomal protein S15